MSCNMPPNTDDSVPQGSAAVEWVLIYVALVTGSSIFLLPYAMGQSGFFMFCLLLGLATYFTGMSKIYLYEIATDYVETERPQRSTTPIYSTIVEWVSGERKGKWIKVVGWIYTFDIIICTAFYFKITARFALSFCDIENLPPCQQQPYEAAAYIFIAVFLMLTQYGRKMGSTLLSSKAKIRSIQTDEKPTETTNESQQEHETSGTESKEPYPESKTSESSQSDLNWQASRSSFSTKESVVNFQNNFIDTVCLPPGELYDEQQADVTQTKDVVDEMYDPDRRGPWLLFFLMLFIFYQCQRTWSLYSDDDLKPEFLNSTECPGFKSPKFFKNPDSEVLVVLPLIIFALMNYAIAVPVSREQLRLEKKEYCHLVLSSKVVIFLFFVLFAISFYIVFGESTPAIATMAYGRNIDGFILNLLALCISVVAIWLRVMLCCRIIQVFFKLPNERDHWIIVMALFFISFFIAINAKSVLHIAVLAGIVNCNLILNIIPCILYIVFKRVKYQYTVWHIVSSLKMALLQLIVHVGLLLLTVPALLAVKPDVGMSCPSVFKEIFS